MILFYIFSSSYSSLHSPSNKIIVDSSFSLSSVKIPIRQCVIGFSLSCFDFILNIILHSGPPFESVFTTDVD